MGVGSSTWREGRCDLARGASLLSCLPLTGCSHTHDAHAQIKEQQLKEHVENKHPKATFEVRSRVVVQTCRRRLTTALQPKAALVDQPAHVRVALLPLPVSVCTYTCVCVCHLQQAFPDYQKA